MTVRRIKRIFENAGEDLGAILLYNGAEPHVDVNFFYVTDLTKGLFEGSAVVIYPDGKGAILTSELERESASRSHMEKRYFSSKDDFRRSIKELLDVDGDVGINFADIQHSAYRTMKLAAKGKRFRDVSDVLEKSRMIKDRTEIERIRTAAKIATDALGDMIKELREGSVEYEAAALLIYEMMKRGATGPAFETIASFGENSAEPHYTAGNRKLRRGDYALFDYGAHYERYNSDTTRTFVLGKADKKHREVYEIVKEAQQAGIDAVRDGAYGPDVDAAARNIIEKAGYGDRFIHSLGHGLGLKVHDGGGLSPRLKMELKEGMVVTVEPGIYLPGWGGVRIEDDVVVKKNGAEVLTHFPKELMEL